MRKFTVEFTFHDLLDDVVADNEDEAKEIARNRLEHSDDFKVPHTTHFEINHVYPTEEG